MIVPPNNTEYITLCRFSGNNNQRQTIATVERGENVLKRAEERREGEGAG